jgi:hypothetical protein
MNGMQVPARAWIDLVCDPDEWKDKLPGRLINRIRQRNRRLSGLLRRRCG